MIFDLPKKIKYAYFQHRKGYSLDDFKGEINVNLGCGNRPLEGFFNIDYYNKKFADEIIDLSKDFPFQENSIDLIYSDNFFEHLSDTISLVDRCYKCLKPGGRLVIEVPYFKSKHAFVDPTHVRFFTIQTLDYFVRGKYFNKMFSFTDNSFSDMSVFLDPGANSRIRDLIASYAIKKPNDFENSILSSIFVFHKIVFVLIK